MTFGQFLHDASFWQWIGLIILAVCLCSFSPVTINHIHTKDDK